MRFPSSASAEEPAVPLKSTTDEAASSGCGTYASIDGWAKIVGVEETAASTAQAWRLGYEVWLSFTPNKPASGLAAANWIGRSMSGAWRIPPIRL